jgi:hypothetical protein
MDPKRDKAKEIAKEAREISDYLDSRPEDNTPRTEGKRAEESTYWPPENSSEEPHKGYYEPSKSHYYGEASKSYPSDPAGSARSFREYGEAPSHERGPKKTWQKDREGRIKELLWERERDESGK